MSDVAFSGLLPPWLLPLNSGAPCSLQSRAEGRGFVEQFLTDKTLKMLSLNMDVRGIMLILDVSEILYPVVG